MGMVEGKDFFFVTFDQMGFLNYNDMMVVTRPWLNANRPALVGYFKALIEADAINEKDPAVAAKLVIDKYGANLGLDLKQQTQQNQLQLAMVRPGGDPKFPIYNVDPKLVAGPMYDAATATGRADLGISSIPACHVARRAARFAHTRHIRSPVSRFGRCALCVEAV